MSPLSNFTNDLAEIISDFPSVMTYGNVSLTVSETDLTQEFLIDGEGVYDPLQKQVTAVRSDFQEGIPAPREIVTLDRVKYHIEQVENDQHTDSVVLTLRRLK